MFQEPSDYWFLGHFSVGLGPGRDLEGAVFRRSLSLRSQKQTWSRHLVKMVAAWPPVPDILLDPCWSCLQGVCAQQCSGGCSDTPRPRGGCGPGHRARVSSLGRRMLCLPWGPRRRELLGRSGRLGLLQRQRQGCPDFEGAQAARVRTRVAKTT